jgi:hypothetical protein
MPSSFQVSDLNEQIDQEQVRLGATAGISGQLPREADCLFHSTGSGGRDGLQISGPWIPAVGTSSLFQPIGRGARIVGVQEQARGEPGEVEIGPLLVGQLHEAGGCGEMTAKCQGLAVRQELPVALSGHPQPIGGALGAT